MNNRGQSLIIFIILIPIILFVFVFIYDYSVVVYEQKKLDNINSSSIVFVYEKTEVEIREIIHLNDSNVFIDYYTYKDNISIKLKKKINGFLKDYELISHYIAYYNNKDVYIERGN